MKSIFIFGGVVMLLGMATDLARAQDTTTTFGYDAQGNRTSITNPLGQTITIGHDALNRPIRLSDPLGTTTLTAFDALDQVRQITDPRNLFTRYGINYLGNQLSLSSPDTGSASAQFDAHGNLIQKTDARGIKATYTRDALHRVTRVEWTGGGKSTSATIANQFVYDQGANGIGHLTSFYDESGQTSLAYDLHGRLISQSQTLNGAPKSFQVAYGYGTAGSETGHLTSMRYASGNRIQFSYDAAGRVQSLTLHGPNHSVIKLLEQISYLDFASVNGWVWGNGLPYARQFDLNGRLIHYPLGDINHGGLNRSVEYDAASRVRAFTHSGNVPQAAGLFDQRFAYDNLDRVTQFSANNLRQVFRYDANGNRTELQQNAANWTNEIAPASNQLQRTTGPGQTRVFTYDAAGNPQSDGMLNFEFAANNRLRAVRGPAGTTTYGYNALGQRVKKSGATGIAGQDVNYYVYDAAGHLLGEYDRDGNAIQETVYLDGLPVVVLRQEELDTVPYYIYSDHINTPRVITRSSDNMMVWRWDQADPFGAMAPDDSPAGLAAFTYNLRFPGQVFDVESGLHQNYHREYLPGDGRYLQSDPIGLKGGINTYAYVDGNPIIRSDPSGLDWGSDLVGATVGSGFDPNRTQQTESCPADHCKDTITVHTGGTCVPGDAMCIKGMQAAGMSPPYEYTSMTLDRKCLMKLGLGVAVPKFAAGSAAGKYGPGIAARGIATVSGTAGAYAGMVGTTVAELLATPVGITASVLGAGQFLIKQCECKVAK